jgi:adenylate cyclase
MSLEQAIASYDIRQHRSHASITLTDNAVVCLSYAALSLWLLGYPDQALQRSREALSLAQEISESFSLAVALVFAGGLHQFRREGHAGHERAEAVIALSAEQGFAMWLGWGTFLQGWALAEQGQGKEGMAQMCYGLNAYQAIGAEILRPYFLALLAEAYGKVGQAEEGLRLLTEALELVDKNGERLYEAELHRLKGVLLLQEGKRQKAKGKRQKALEAEESFRQALDIARHQQAKSLELRAAISLSRLWQQQGKREEARELLAEIYGWFTEGFDTTDLREAKALLDELG